MMRFVLLFVRVAGTTTLRAFDGHDRCEEQHDRHDQNHQGHKESSCTDLWIFQCQCEIDG